MSGICSRQIVPETRSRVRKVRSHAVPDYVDCKEFRMTSKRLEVLEFVKSYIRENGFAPSNADIRKAVNLRSSSTVCIHLKALRFLGRVSYTDGRPRSLVVIPEADLVDQLAEAILEHCHVALDRDQLREAVKAAGVRV